MFYPKTWGCFGALHGGVLYQNMGMFLPIARYVVDDKPDRGAF